MNNTITSVSFSIFSNKGIYALLLGSGISKKAGVPTGWDIVIDLICKLAIINNEDCSSNPEKWFQEKYNQEANYSSILSKLAKSQAERMNFLKPYFEATEEEVEQKIKQPTETHKSIVQLIKKGYIRVVITTNFDRLLEKALAIEGIEPIIIKHPDDIDGALPLVHSKFIIIKINGDYLDSRLLNTTEELSSYNTKMKKYITRIINEFGIISCGWSGKWDIGLVDAIKQCENFRFYSYWTYINQCEDELKDIATYRKGEALQIIDSDTFFRLINENINALENINQNHPLSKDIAIARLKKYIVKDEYKIHLHDLIYDQLNELSLNLRTKDDVTIRPCKDTIIPIFTHYISNLETTIHLIINGIYWGKEEHDYLFIDILKLASEPIKTNGLAHMQLTIKLFNLPSLIILYSIGLSALKKDNFNIINKCFNLKINKSDHVSYDNNYLIEIANPCITNRNEMKVIFEDNYYTPLSTYLYNILKPFFTNNFYNAKEFDESFLIFEYLLSLNYYHIVEKGWIPWGEYAWKVRWDSSNMHILHNFIKDAQRKQNDWKPLLSGMFNGSFQDFENAKVFLDDFLTDLHFY